MEPLEPILRFPEFKIIDSNSYTKYYFKDIFNFSTGKNIKQNEASPEFETLCVRYGELYHMYNEVIDEVINKTNLNKSELVFSEGNEILLPSAGEDPLDIGSASALIVKNVAIGRTINILKPINVNIYSQIYVSYYINHKLRKKISTLAKGSSISNVYNSDLKTLEIILPNLQEQTKIATFLTTIDKKIYLLKQKKSVLEEYKRGIMQKIFSQEIRFKDENGNYFKDWVEKSLGEICIKAQSGGTPKSTNKKFYNGDIPFLSISDITKQGKYLKDTEKSISKEGLDNSSSWLVPINSIIYTMYASVGFVSINKTPIATSQAVFNLILKEDYDIEFVYYLLVDFKKNIDKYITTGTQGNLSAQTVKGFVLNIPSKKEQIKIANFLSKIDDKIELVNIQIEDNIEYKKGIFQKMFI